MICRSKIASLVIHRRRTDVFDGLASAGDLTTRVFIESSAVEKGAVAIRRDKLTRIFPSAVCTVFLPFATGYEPRAQKN